MEEIDSSDTEVSANEANGHEIETAQSAGPPPRKQRTTPVIACSKNDALAPFYQLKAKDIDGNVINMSEYHGKLLLIVNVASR